MDGVSESYRLDFSNYDEELNLSAHGNSSSTYVLDRNTLTCETRLLPAELNAFMCAFYVLVFLLAVPGNLVVGLVVGSSRHELSPSDLFLFHLAVADVLLALTLPLWAASVPHGWVFGDAACKLVNVVMEVNFYASILFLVCISADRYLIIVRQATRGGRQGLRASWAACGAVWALGGALSLPAGLFNDAFTDPMTGKATCGERYDDAASAQAWRLATRVLRQVLGFAVPLAAMLAFYGVTAARLLRTRQGQRKQRAMRVITAVVAAFLLCWCPHHLAVGVDTLMRARLVAFSCRGRRAADHALLATQTLALLHCCVNPVLYAFVGQKFRANLLQMLRRQGIIERGSTATTRFSRSTSTTSQDGTNALM